MSGGCLWADIGGCECRSAVEAFYRVLLMREPDLPGLNANVALITEGQRTLEETLAAFFKSEEFQSIAPRVLESYAPRRKPDLPTITRNMANSVSCCANG